MTKNNAAKLSNNKVKKTIVSDLSTEVPKNKRKKTSKKTKKK